MRNAVIFALLLGVAPPAAADADMSQVDALFGRKPAVSGDVMRYGFPRSDLKVVVDGVTLKPALALGGWVAFKALRSGAMIMGDLVLTENEINPVMAKLLSEGVEVTALHNHLLRANPPTYYMHVGGMGDPVKMATAIRDALALTATPMIAPAAGNPPPLDLDAGALDKALGAKGKAVGGVYQFAIARDDVVNVSGMAAPASMGSADVVNFQPTGGGKAAITGDIVALAAEVEPLITALRKSGIEVTAIHNHMLEDAPRTFFIHFWANDDAVKLAAAMRSAIDAKHAGSNK
ncbi:MAG: DUF1259 domain-containing protein [Pseudomonadota bacterium]|nr:DUF1259 domain-containing protein [Pseudomonadota bacterium]